MRAALPVRWVFGLAVVTGASSAALAQPPAAAQATQVAQNRDYTMMEPGKAAGGGCAPLAVISRGLGAGQNPMRSLATALTQDGWRVVVMRHPDSGRSVFSGRLVRSGRLTPKTGDEQNPEQLRRRAEAIDGALAMAGKVCEAPFKVLIGHAVGSTTALIEAGAKPRFPEPSKDRFNAYVALSPTGPGEGVFTKESWGGLAKPILVVTGTRDLRARGGWRPRTAAYDGMPPGGKRLAIVQGATLVALGGIGSPSVRLKVAKVIVDFIDDARRGELKADPVPGVEFKEK